MLMQCKDIKSQNLLSFLVQVSLLTSCLEEPVALRAPVEVALEAEEQLYDRYGCCCSCSER